MNDSIEIIIGSLIGVAGLVTAVISVCFALKASNNAKKAALGSTLTYCVERYTNIVQYKHDAIKEKSQLYAEQYYRELFDLFWSEAYLWIYDMIPDHIMLHWVQARATSMNKGDKIEIDNNPVTYEDRWKHAAKGVFKTDDCFLEFMKNVHENQISELSNMKKEKEEFKRRLAEKSR